METIESIVFNLYEVSKEAAPWLLLGLVFAGLVKVMIPADWMARWLGKKGAGSVFRAAVIGIPLPLCSCGVLPAAIGIRKHGASKGSTISFLVATPQNGVDSIMLSYALLGPFLAVMRPVASLISSLTAGLLSDVVDRNEEVVSGERAVKSCCASKQVEEKVEEKGGCCGSEAKVVEEKEEGGGCCSKKKKEHGVGSKVVMGLKFAVSDILDDIVKWLVVGLVLAALINTFVSEDQIAEFGSGFVAMLMMVLIGVPMYICASASTPLGASLLAIGISPGTVLVFLLAGPATNIAGLAIVKKELGLRVCVAYLVGIIGGAVVCGLATDGLMGYWLIEMDHQMSHAKFLPTWVEIGSLVVLVFCGIRPLRELVMKG